MINGKLLNEVLKRDDYRCQGCGNTRHLELHHIIFRSQGGKDEADNLVMLCRRCHQRTHKNNEWRRYWERWAAGVRG